MAAVLSSRQSFFRTALGSLGWIIGLSAAGAAMAAEEVRFHRAELDAFLLLSKPETTSLRLDGRTGQFRPGPSLRFAGVEDQDFEVDLNLGGSLVDLRFNDLRARAPSITFEPGRILLEIAFHDQEKAIRSLLGAISLRGVSVRAGIRFAENGDIRLEYESGALFGEMRGTGLLRPRWVIEAIQRRALKTLKREIERTLSRPEVQQSIENGLLLWARFSRDPNLSSVVKRSVVVEADAIRYEIE